VEIIRYLQIPLNFLVNIRSTLEKISGSVASLIDSKFNTITLSYLPKIKPESVDQLLCPSLLNMNFDLGNDEEMALMVLDFVDTIEVTIKALSAEVL
jgi:hypothetical protein